MAAYWKTHRLKGHEKLIFVGYLSFKIEVLRDFKFTKNKDLTQKRAVWAGAWDKTLTIIPQSYRGTSINEHIECIVYFPTLVKNSQWFFRTIILSTEL